MSVERGSLPSPLFTRGAGIRPGRARKKEERRKREGDRELRQPLTNSWRRAARLSVDNGHPASYYGCGKRVWRTLLCPGPRTVAAVPRPTVFLSTMSLRSVFLLAHLQGGSRAGSPPIARRQGRRLPVALSQGRREPANPAGPSRSSLLRPASSPADRLRPTAWLTAAKHSLVCCALGQPLPRPRLSWAAPAPLGTAPQRPSWLAHKY